MVASALVLASGCGQDSTSRSTSTSTTADKEFDAGVVQRLDDAINKTMDETSIPGAIVGIWGPDGNYVQTYGVADQAGGEPMQTDFYHRIGSQTKTFTVTAVLQLADQGKLGLDDPISKFVDGVPEGDAITLRQLARMQSGLPNYSATSAFQQAFFEDPFQNFTPQQLLDYAFAEPMEFPPGEGFLYCNTNTVLLGLVVEKVSGQSLPDYIHEHITQPLGMSHTSFPTTNAFPKPHAQGYTTQDADNAITTATDWNPSWGWAAGAMISSLEDMHIWVPALATGKLLTPEMQKQRLQTVSPPGTPPGDGYGVGIFNIGGWIGHNGSLPGYQTVGVYLPEKQTTLVIFTNTDIDYQGQEPSTLLAKAITEVITPDHIYTLGEAVEPPDVTPPPSPPTTTKPR
ncbi:serine hydrolase [Mycolicibacterium moriokaense]|jgi:D-alanyl-D-alanine carboxypeptidase|uniref:Beta-lactamase n=2 Tax=Mycolicibacterium moriokaense TaxID=39691 RepID=A0AAD1M5T5_9MYCO|nr:serine hydrolase domain-containing protein [Mycolicibacterium moriokaense]ORB27143.1 serine hydrolase [Mycolicibacterium moriokaense]BBX00826.1 beta-lactamase [Mycolicibacterium moriokaense]